MNTSASSTVSNVDIAAASSLTGVITLIDELSTNQQHFFHDGTLIKGFNMAQSTPLSSIDMYIGALNNNGSLANPSGIQWGWWSAGSGQYAQQSIKNTLIKNYMSSVGAL